MTVVVSLVAVAGLVIESRTVEARAVVCPRKTVFAHPHETHDAKRNRAERHQLGQRHPASQKANRGRLLLQQPAQLSSNRLEAERSVEFALLCKLP